MLRVVLLAVIFVVGIVVSYFIISDGSDKKLKVYNPTDINAELVDDEVKDVGFGHKIAPFTFTNQNGVAFGSKQLKNKIYVAEYFFTTCGTICPIMNSNMQTVQEALKDESDFHIVSITVDPETDSPKQLKAYAKAHGANDKQWHFLTGEKEQLYQLARKSFFVLKPAETRNQGDVGSDFIHTNYFVLVDRQQRIRGYYDGTNKHEVEVLINDAKLLLEE